MAMQYSDRVGYDVLLSQYSVICKSSLDPSDLARSLLQCRIINQGTVDQSRASASQSEKIGTLLDAVIRSGAPHAFESFMTAMRSDGSADVLARDDRVTNSSGSENCRAGCRNQLGNSWSSSPESCGRVLADRAYL